MATSSTPTTYLPGVRNLDAAETAERRRGGWIGVGLSVAAVAAGIGLHAAPPLRLLLLIPVAIAAIGFLQANSRFCVMVALSSRSPAETVSDRSKDRVRAIVMIATATLIGAIAAAIAYVV